MPLDSNIILAGAAPLPKPFDPLEQFQKLQAAKIAQQQAQAGQLQLQQAQKAQADDEAFRQMVDPSDDQVLRTLGPQRGGALIKSRQEARKLGTETQKAAAELQEKQNDIRGHIAFAASQAGPPTDQTVASAAYELNSAGLKQDAQMLQQAWQQGGAQAVTPLLQKAISSSGAIQKQIAEQQTAQSHTQQAQTQAQRLQLETPEIQAKSQAAQYANMGQVLGSATNAAQYQERYNQAMQVNPEAVKGFPPPDGSIAPILAARKLGMTAAQQATDSREQAQFSEKQNQDAIQNKQADQRLAISRGELGVAQGNLALRSKEFKQQFGNPLDGMSADQQATVAKYASGDFKLPPAGSRAPGAQAIRQAAIAMNPNLSDDTFTVKHDFNDPSKTGGKNLATIGRIVGHIGRFEKNSSAMSGTESMTFGMGATMTGNQKAADEDSHAIAAELEKLTSGGVGTADQTKAWQKALRSPSADVRQKAVDEISQLIGSQYESMNQTYKAQTNEDLPMNKYVTPAGRQWMANKGINVKGTADGPNSGNPPAHIQSLRSRYNY